jgi:putative FmdB family regulatory protein
MPIYEYVCTACDHRADILHGINDPGPHFCPSCGREGTMRKQFAPPAIHYKGSGWAKKDRGSSSSGTKASRSSGDGARDGGSASGEGAGSKGASGSSGSSGSTSGGASGSGGSSGSDD